MPLQSEERPEVTPDMSRVTSVQPSSDDEIRRTVLPSKRDKRRAKEAKKRADEAEAAIATKLDRKSKGAKHRSNIEDLTTLPATQTPSGRAERVGDSADKAAPFQPAQNKKSANKGKPSNMDVEVTEADLQRVIDSIEDKCQKLRDKWEGQRQGMFGNSAQLKSRSD